MNRICLWALLLAVTFCCNQVQAAPLGVVDEVPAVSAKDQWGTNFVFTTNLQYLVIATEMTPAKSANHKLAEQGADYLEKHGAAYLMDIHPMPGIARVFALPKFRKYPERMVLVDAEGVLDGVPRQPERVTVLKLTATGHIQKIAYWDPEAEPVDGIFQ